MAFYLRWESHYPSLYEEPGICRAIFVQGISKDAGAHAQTWRVRPINETFIIASRKHLSHSKISSFDCGRKENILVLLTLQFVMNLFSSLKGYFYNLIIIINILYETIRNIFRVTQVALYIPFFWFSTNTFTVLIFFILHLFLNNIEWNVGLHLALDIEISRSSIDRSEMCSSQCDCVLLLKLRYNWT